MRRRFAQILLFMAGFHVWLDWTRTVSVGDPLELLTLEQSFELFWPGTRAALEVELAGLIGEAETAMAFVVLDPVPLSFFIAMAGGFFWAISPTSEKKQRFVFARKGRGRSVA